MLTNIICPYTFNQTSAMTCELFSQSSFLKGLSLHWNIELCAWSGAMLWLLANLLWLLQLYSLVFPTGKSSVLLTFYTFCFCPYFFYKFQCFHVFIVVRWPILFPCLVVLWVSVFYIANWLLFVWTCVGNHNLAAYHFQNNLYNCYISVICLDLYQKSQSVFFVSVKS